MILASICLLTAFKAIDMEMGYKFSSKFTTDFNFIM